MSRMALNESRRELCHWPRCLTLDDALHMLDFWEDGCSHARSSLQDTGLFISLERCSTSERQYLISDEALFSWFLRLNARVADAGVISLEERQVRRQMDFLLESDKWESVPGSLLNYGLSRGLIRESITPGRYVFPVARVLSSLRPSVVLRVCDELEQLGTQKECLQASAGYWINTGLSVFDERVSRVIRAREGIDNGTFLTLEDIARHEVLTRERVRQIEQKFWKGLTRSPAARAIFVKGLIGEIVRRHGSLVCASDDVMLRFLAKCADNACTVLEGTGLVLLTHGPKRLRPEGLVEAFPATVSEEELPEHLASQEWDYLCRDDLVSLAAVFADVRKRKMTKIERLYLALKAIGKPSHYSEIRSRYNEMFPFDRSDDHTILAALGRDPKRIVWVGLNGVYALREWGFGRPETKIFEAVLEIVKMIHDQTASPVSLQQIIAEIGKYRRLINQNSVTIAANLHPQIKRVGKDCFVPSDRLEPAASTSEDDRIDQVLRELWQTEEGGSRRD